MLTVITQIFFTGRIIRWLGLAVTLALLPLSSMLGFGALGAHARRSRRWRCSPCCGAASNFAITNPAMEVLFTVVPREDKYKAKNIIETFVYRGGDQVGAWVYAGLAGDRTEPGRDLVRRGSAGAVWLGLGLWLGRRQAVLAGEVGTGRVVTSPATSVPATT